MPFLLTSVALPIALSLKCIKALLTLTKGTTMLSRDTELYLKGMRLNGDDIEMLEQALVENADNIKMRIQLLAYFASNLRGQLSHELTIEQKNHFAKHHARHSLYIIGHHPLDRISMRTWAIIDADNAPEDHERARTLWLAHLMSKPPEAQLLLNALAFLRQSEPAIASKLAEQIRQLPDAAAFEADLKTLEEGAESP